MALVARRAFIAGLAAALAAPAIVRAGVLMAISPDRSPLWVPISWFATDTPLYEIRWRGLSVKPILHDTAPRWTPRLHADLLGSEYVDAANCNETFMRRYANSITDPGVSEAQALAAHKATWAAPLDDGYRVPVTIAGRSISVGLPQSAQPT